MFNPLTGEPLESTPKFDYSLWDKSEDGIMYYTIGIGFDSSTAETLIAYRENIHTPHDDWSNHRYTVNVAVFDYNGNLVNDIETDFTIKPWSDNIHIENVKFDVAGNGEALLSVASEGKNTKLGSIKYK